jgi:plastocyanin
MKTKNIEQGFVWFIVSVVLAIVLAVLLLGKDASAPETNDPSADQVRQAASSTATASTTGNATVGAAPKTVTTTTPPPPALPKMTPSGAYIVYYTSSGFSPASLSLVRGQASVRFINNSSSALRVAPVDTVNKPYSEFSQSKSVGNGGIFDYTFTSAGSYAYFNENNKAHQALITVK